MTFVSPDPSEPIDVDGALIALETDPRSQLSVLGARAIMLRLKQITTEREANGRLLEAVAMPYKQRDAQLAKENDRLRDSLQAFLTQTDGKVSIPDAGTAYLSKRGPKVNVTDKEMLVRWWRDDAGREVPMTNPQPEPDLSRMKLLILDELGETGEVPPAGSGVEVEGPSKGLVVRS